MPEMKIARKNVLLDLFMESIKKGIDDAESGNTVKCEDRIDRKKLFESL